MKKTIVFTILIALGFLAQAQDKVWVFFKDKDTANFNPYTFFDSKAIERRMLNGINLYDYTDVPVNEAYISQIIEITQNNRAVSRWFNAVCCLATPEQQKELLKLPFVSSVRIVSSEIQKYFAGMEQTDDEGNFTPTDDEIDFLKAQIKRMNGETFSNNKIDGSGVRVAIFDVGFKSYKTNPAFEHIRAENRIIATYDFAKNKENVDCGGTHGCFVMSCVGGKINGQIMGLATGAQYLLARTETRTEFYAEEENWLEAAEWADKNGADIINSSLGYTIHRYFVEDMDGTHSLVAKAANMAASKGIIVVNSAGNEGSNDWKRIGTPADADSVLSIGGINPKTGIHTSFSSFGPTWDKRMKPNVTAYGHVIGSGPKGISETQGTSFSGPLVAGFVACAKQIRMGYKSMDLFHEIEKSADLYPYFDYAHGYGVPQAKYFIIPFPQEPSPSFEIVVKSKTIEIMLTDTTSIDEETLKWEGRYVKCPDYLFYHIQNDKGYLDKYFVIDPFGSLFSDKYLSVEDEDLTQTLSPLKIKKTDYARPFTLRVFYRGYFKEIVIK
ncbi:MAG: S8 family serine peptidase [Flavobacteriales bacterium]|nr:S8 family serine peptidase [Flavobacteriales bacterium]